MKIYYLKTIYMKLNKLNGSAARSLTNSNITIKDQIYSLKITGNKRELVYDYNNKLIGTKSFIFPINHI